MREQFELKNMVVDLGAPSERNILSKVKFFNAVTSSNNLFSDAFYLHIPVI